MTVLTRKQFLKRSKECVDAEGVHALDIRGLIDKESTSEINDQNAYKQIKNIMDGLGELFTKYERLKPPSEYTPLKLKILNSLVILQEAAAANYDYINLNTEGKKPVDAEIKLRDSKELLNKFRTIFYPITTEVETQLAQR